jgi:hypothetical protein
MKRSRGQDDDKSIGADLNIARINGSSPSRGQGWSAAVVINQKTTALLADSAVSPRSPQSSLVTPITIISGRRQIAYYVSRLAG